MKLRIYQVDSFTRECFHGNPAGVVPNADGLTEVQMQQIARELNNSETAFIFSSNDDSYDVEVRFFTPTTEVPLCGHATIAAHYVRAIEGQAPGRTIQKTKAGLLPIDTIPDGHDFSIIMTMAEPYVSEPFDSELAHRIAEALGLDKGDVRADCPIAIASAGHSKVMVGIRSRQILDSLHPDEARLTEISKEIGCNGYYVFTLSPEEDVLVHGRMFAPAIGISEDPVTGNANGPLGIYLVHFGICPDLQTDDCFDFCIRQGEAIGRDGGMKVHVEKKGGRPVLVQITGEAAVAFKTEIEL